MIKRIALVVLLGLLYNPFCSFGQDSIAAPEDLEEEKQLKFQQFFFKALSEKSIKNYQKAIENLETCNEILPKDVSVYFEFSKNYFLLNKYEEAKEYIKRALLQDPKNEWMLTHLVTIHKKERNFKEAIDVQLEIIKVNSKKKGELVRLYYLNRDYDKALALMNDLEKGEGLSRNLKRMKASLELRKGVVVNGEKKEDLQSLIANFENNSTSFSALKKLLDVSQTKDQKLFHKYSQQAVELFPAQPYAYLVRGKSLQMQGKHQQAITILESGIDFVIDNVRLEANFYETMAKAYDGLGNATKAQEYRDKAKKLKNS